jgi:hypothetical protein
MFAMKARGQFLKKFLSIGGSAIFVTAVLYFMILPSFIQRISGATGLALDLNGISDFVSVPALNVGNAFSVEIIFNSDISGDYATLLGDNWLGTNFGGIFFDLNELQWWHRGQKKLFVSGLATSTWYHLTFVADGTTVTLYIDGELSASGTFSPTYDNLLRIGDSSDDPPWDGKVDEFRIYNRALSAQEALEHSQAVFNNETGLQVLYHFNEALSSTAVDSSGLGNDGTIFGGSWVTGPPQSFPDTTFPSISITAPGDLDPVSSTVSVSADASDNAGIAGVQFYLDGVRLEAEVVSAPYSIFWDTTSTTDGIHILTAVARDAEGNMATSTPVRVTVDNRSGELGAPVRFGGSPTGTLAAGTVSANLALSTRERATCKYSTTPLTPYASMINTFTTTGSITHSSKIAVTDGITYTYYVKCQDLLGNTNLDDFIITFSVAIDTGFALELNGSTDLVLVPTLNAGNAFSMEIVFNSDIPGDYATLLKDDWLFGTLGSFYFDLNEVQWWYKGRKKLFVSDLATSTWYHFAFVADGSTASLYIDGGLKARDSFLLRYDNDLRIGDSDGGTLWDGKVDEFRVYDRALSAQEVLEHSQAIFNDESRLQILYHFNEGSAIPIVGNFKQKSPFVIFFKKIMSIFSIRNSFVLFGGPSVITQNFVTQEVGLSTYDASGRGNNGIIFGGSWVIGPPQSPNPNQDTTPPSVSIIAPLHEATVEKKITVSADASDNVGVAGVQFYLDGVRLEAEDVSAPHSIRWKTKYVENGAHILTAVARDTAGLSVTSDEVTVVVDNKPKCFTIKMKTGLDHPEVKDLQEALQIEGFFPENIEPSTYFGSTTEQAVIKFQEAYRDELLTPLNLTRGNGLFEKDTKDKMNKIFCKKNR